MVKTILVQLIIKLLVCAGALHAGDNHSVKEIIKITEDYVEQHLEM